MKTREDHCAALEMAEDGRYPCTIYEVRPDDCRLVEPGSPACLEARRLGKLGRSVDYFNPLRSRPPSLGRAENQVEDERQDERVVDEADDRVQQ